MGIEPKTMRHLGAVIVTLIISILIVVGMGNILFGVVSFIGILFFYASGEAFIDYCRVRTTLFFANVGQKGRSSIIQADMFPLKSPYKDGKSEYMVCCTGGSSVPYLPFHGFGPVFICPKDYVKTTFHGGIVAIADWHRVKFDSLPRSFQKALKDRLEHFNSNMGFYWADTSPFNNLMQSEVDINLTERNLEQETKINELNQYNQELITTVNNLINTLKELKGTGEMGYDNRRQPPWHRPRGDDR